MTRSMRFLAWLAAVSMAVLQAASAAARPDSLRDLDRMIQLGRYDAVENNARHALGDLESAGRGSTRQAVRYADLLVEALLRGGRGSRNETLDRARMSLQVSENLHGVDSVQAARSLERLGRVLTRRSDYSAAEEKLARSQRILKGLPRLDDKDLAQVEQSIGHLACQRGDYAAAQQSFQHAMEIRESAFGKDHPAVAETLRIVGECDLARHDLAVSMSRLHRSRQILEAAAHSRHPELALTLSDLAEAHALAGEFAEASQCIETAVEILVASVGPESPLIVIPLERRASLAAELGDYSTATATLERVLAIERSEFGQADLTTLRTLRRYAVLRAMMGAKAEAADLFGEVAEKLEVILGPTHPEVIRALENRGTALSSAKRFVEAGPLLTRALDLWIQALGPNNRRVAVCLVNLTGHYTDAGDPAKAREYGLQALSIMDSTHDTDASLRGSILGNLGNATRQLGDLPEALRLAEESRSVMELAYGSAYPDVSRAMHNQAQLLIESGRVSEGVAVTLRAEKMSRENLALTAQTASEHDALTLAAPRVGFLDILVTLATIDPDSRDGRVREAWDNTLRSRALILDELIARRRASLANADPETTALKELFTLASERLAKLVMAGPGPTGAATLEDELAAARDARRASERAYAARSTEFRDRLTEGAAGLDDVIAALPADSALIAFVRYQHYVHLASAPPTAGRHPRQPQAEVPSYAAFVVSSAGRIPRVVPLGDASRIDALIGRWRESIAGEALSAAFARNSSDAGYRNPATELRQAVWDPIAHHVGGTGRVFLVPDGAINLVNFSALPIGEKEYLVEHSPMMHYLTSERDLLREAQAFRETGGLLALSDPAFDESELFAAMRPQDTGSLALDGGSSDAVFRGGRSGCAAFRAMSFEPLPATAGEAYDVVEQWQQQPTDDARGIQSFSGSSASESAFKRNASGKRILHLATHGFFLGGQCGSALDPSMSTITRETPLLLSGLALAGANHRDAAGEREDDGILTAEEISTLDLRGTEWAVLSACDTGMGEIRAGEGVFGLRRAFQLAGTRSVIMSLWPVEDESTRQWMAALYRHRLAGHESTIESVNHASRELLEQRRARGESTHPFYWAGFIAAGDWR